MTVTTEYVPGVCNIGRDEIRTRRRLGLVGVAVTLAFAAALFALGAGPGWFVLLFFPAFGTAIGLVQSAARFCVHFGLAGLFNFGAQGATENVALAVARKADRVRAWQLVLRATLYAAAATLAAVVVAIVA